MHNTERERDFMRGSYHIINKIVTFYSIHIFFLDLSPKFVIRNISLNSIMHLDLISILLK